MAKIKTRFIDNVLVGDMVAEGKCITKTGEKVIFIEGAVPGDIVNLQVLKEKKSFIDAKAIKVIEPSQERVEPFCKHFGTCGGCKWQFFDYERQLYYKQKQVYDAIERIGKVAVQEYQPILGSAQTTFYRNKMEFTFSNRRWLAKEEIGIADPDDKNALGFHIPRMFDKILNIDDCWLQPEPSNAIRNWVKNYAEEQGFSFFDVRNQVGYLRTLLIRNSPTTGEWMVLLQVTEDKPETLAMLEALQAQFPEISSLFYVINTKGNDTLEGLEPILFSGKPYIIETMEGLEFRISPKSFYQTNSLQAYELYKIAREFAGLDGSQVVYDLYTGTGTIANFVAKQAKKVIGIEYVEVAIADAKVNAEVNGLKNTAFFAGDMKDVLTTEFIAQNGRPDVIITDPPRAGMHPEVVNVILKASPEKIVYVSCNPATQARDIEMLSAQYEVLKIKPVDMFPHTLHIESVALLKKK